MPNSARAGHSRLSGSDLRERYAAFLGRFPWELFGTITSRHPMSEARAEEVWHKVECEVRHRLGHRFDFARVKEPFDFRPGCHIHFLALDCRGLHRLDFVNWAWVEIGKAHLVPYDSRLGAGYYMSKYVVKSELSGFDVRLSPRLGKFKLPKSAKPLALGGGLMVDYTPGTRGYLRGSGAQDAPDLE